MLVGVLANSTGTGIREQLLAPVWTGADDPVERIFAFSVVTVRTPVPTTYCGLVARIGSLGLESTNPIQRSVQILLAANFTQLVTGDRECLDAAQDCLGADLDRRALANSC